MDPGGTHRQVQAGLPAEIAPLALLPSWGMASPAVKACGHVDSWEAIPGILVASSEMSATLLLQLQLRLLMLGLDAGCYRQSCMDGCTMRFESVIQVLAQRMLKYYRTSWWAGAARAGGNCCGSCCCCC